MRTLRPDASDHMRTSSLASCTSSSPTSAADTVTVLDSFSRKRPPGDAGQAGPLGIPPPFLTSRSHLDVSTYTLSLRCALKMPTVQHSVFDDVRYSSTCPANCEKGHISGTSIAIHTIR